MQPVYSIQGGDRRPLVPDRTASSATTPRRASRAWPPRCCATSTRTPSTSVPTTTSRARSRSSCRRASRTCSSTASSGIAVGMATNIPPHNLRETIDATIAYIDDPQIDVGGLMKHIKGPDFPTGGIIVGRAGHPRRLRDRPRPRGRARARRTSSRWSAGQGGASSSPRCRTRSPRATAGRRRGLIKKIAELVQRRTAQGDLRPRATSPIATGIRLVIELKRDAHPEGRAQQALQAHVAADDLRREHGRARRRRAAHARACCRWSRTTSTTSATSIVRRTKHELREREARLHILEGLLIAIENIDAVIELIRGSRDPETARDALIERFELSRDPGAGDPRPAPPAPDGARDRRDQDRARGRARAHQGAARDPRRRSEGDGPDPRGAAGDQGPLRRRPAHRDHPLRGRDRHRGPDRRPADGHLDHPLGLHQAPAAHHLPPAEARRRRA